MLAPEFLYQFTGAKDAVVQQLETVHRAVDISDSAVTVTTVQGYVVPNDRIFCMTNAAFRVQLLGGIPATLNTVIQMTQPGSAQPRHFIAQTETTILGLGTGNYRGIVNWSGEVWFTTGQIISGVGSWGPVVDDYSANFTLSGISFPRASVTLG